MGPNQSNHRSKPRTPAGHRLGHLLSPLVRHRARSLSTMSPYIHSGFLCVYTIGHHDGLDSWPDTLRIREISCNYYLGSANRGQSIHSRRKSRSRGSGLVGDPEAIHLAAPLEFGVRWDTFGIQYPDWSHWPGASPWSVRLSLP